MHSNSVKDAVKQETDNTAQFTISVDHVEEHELDLVRESVHSSSNDRWKLILEVSALAESQQITGSRRHTYD